MLADVATILQGDGSRRGGTIDANGFRRILVVICVTSVGYGAMMGAYGGARLQILIGAMKLPFMILLTGALCLPSFFVFNTALGLRREFREAFLGVTSSLATFAISLASLAPLLAMVYWTALPTYAMAKLVNGTCFAVAVWAAQIKLAHHYRILIQRNRRHRYCLALWLALYVFVGIQLAWLLRPFVGSPDLPVQILREDAWGNAYIQVWNALVHAFVGD